MTDIDALIARLEAATEGSRELDAAITLIVEREKWPVVEVRQLDRETDDYNNRGPGSRRECLLREGGIDDWAIVHGGDWGATYPCLHYTTSLDAALTLVPEAWTAWELASRAKKTRFSCNLSRLTECDAGEDWAYGSAASAPIAVCIAALKARRQS